MNAYSKLARRRVVAITWFGALLSFGSNALCQPAPTTPAPGPESTASPDPETPPPPADTEFAPTAPSEPGEVAPPPQTDQPEPPAPRGPFSAHSVRLTLLLGTGSTRTDTYFIIGGGVGYFLVDGLEVGADYEAWLFAKPVLQRLSPEARYVFHMVPVIKPYIGAFYRHTFVSDYDDLNSVGGRAGIYYVPRSGRIWIGGGAVYERTLDCTSSEFVDCDSVYPEISIGVSL
ncbi:MAG: hypothetical protein WDO69_00860 [Pseudomonadota bacterium]